MKYQVKVYLKPVSELEVTDRIMTSEGTVSEIIDINPRLGSKIRFVVQNQSGRKSWKFLPAGELIPVFEYM